jgi:hypothetical protein
MERTSPSTVPSPWSNFGIEGARGRRRVRGEHRAERALKLRVARMAAARDLAPARLNALNDVIDHRRRRLGNVREELGVFSVQVHSHLLERRRPGA